MNLVGYVYILSTPPHLDVSKIGKTTKDSKERAKAISSGTGVVQALEVFAWVRVDDCHLVEKLVHSALDGYRVHKKVRAFQTESR